MSFTGLLKSNQGGHDEAFYEWVMGVLVISSYFPVFLLIPIFLFQTPLQSLENIAGAVVFVFGFLSALISKAIIKDSQDTGGDSYHISDLRGRNNEIALFLVVFIATFLLFRNPEMVGLRVIIALIFLFVMTIYVQYRTSLVYNNPILAYLNLRVYEATITPNSEHKDPVRGIVLLQSPSEVSDRAVTLKKIFHNREVYISTDA